MGQGLAGAAVREGRPLVESAYGEIAAPVPHPRTTGSPTSSPPMFWSDEVRGVLGVGRREGRRFEARDASILEAFGGLAALALRNAEMFTQSARQARIQRGFYRVASVLGQSLSRAATLEAIAQAAAEALGAARQRFSSPSSGRLEAVMGGVTTRRRSSDRSSSSGRRSIMGRSSGLLEGRILVSSSVADDERLLPDLRQVAAAKGYLSLLSVPVDAPRDAGRGLVLIFFAEQRTKFGDDDLELARHLAEATRGALERSELFEGERGARALAQRLTRTGRLARGELDPAVVLDEVVQQAPALVNAEAGAFRLLDGEELVVTAADGEGAAAALGSRSPAGGCALGRRRPVGVSGRPRQGGEDERLRGLDPMLQAGHAAFLGVPVGGAEGRPSASLPIASLPREWREEEIEALLAVAASTSARSRTPSSTRASRSSASGRWRSSRTSLGIVAVDREGGVVLWNSAAEAITGVPAAVALGRAPVDVLQRSLESPDGSARGDRLVPITRGRRRSGCL